MTAIDRIESQINEIKKDRELASSFIEGTRDPDAIEEYVSLTGDTSVVLGIRYAILDLLAHKYGLYNDERDSAEVNCHIGSNLAKVLPQEIINSIAIVRSKYELLYRQSTNDLDRIEKICQTKLPIHASNPTTNSASSANPPQQPPTPTKTIPIPPTPTKPKSVAKPKSSSVPILSPIVLGSAIFSISILLGLTINRNQQSPRVASETTPSLTQPSNPPDRLPDRSIPASPTPTTSIPATPTPATPIPPNPAVPSSRLDPKDFIAEHYDLVNRGEYDRSWNQLSRQFRTKKTSLEAGYREYLEWWNTVDRVDILNTRNLGISNNCNVVEVQLVYNLKTGKTASKRLRFSLTKNNGSWLITDIEHR
jgi:hypothetical protein